MEGWKTSTLGKSCQVVNGATPKTKTQEFWEGSHAWVTPAEMGKRTTPYISATQRTLSDAGLQACSASLLPEQSVIISSRAPIGYLVINTVPMATNQGCKGLIPGSGVKSKFLYYYLYHKVDLLNSLGTGATFKELSATKLKEVPIPLPPLPEQERIVAILDEAFAAIATATANAEKNLANARELFESQLEREFATAQSSSQHHKLKDVCTLRNGRTYKRSELLDQGKYPVLRVGNFFTNRNWYYSDLELEDTKYCDEGDLLYAWSASFGPRIWDGQKAIFHYHIWRVDIDESLMAKDYLFRWFQWDAEKIKAEQGAGTTMVHVSMKSMNARSIALPDLEKQQQICARLLAHNEKSGLLASAYEQKLAHLTNLKQSLLHRAFTGELTADSKSADRSLSEANV